MSLLVTVGAARSLPAAPDTPLEPAAPATRAHAHTRMREDDEKPRAGATAELPAGIHNPTLMTEERRRWPGLTAEVNVETESAVCVPVCTLSWPTPSRSRAAGEWKFGRRARCERYCRVSKFVRKVCPALCDGTQMQPKLAPQKGRPNHPAP